MRALLDTHALVWSLTDDPRLGGLARAFIDDRRNGVLVGVASLWEMAIKISVGKPEVGYSGGADVGAARGQLGVEVSAGRCGGDLPALCFVGRMVRPASTSHVSYAEYLEAEARSEAKHEYLRGEVFEMAGGTPEHAALAAAMTGELIRVLRGRPCRVFSSNARVRVVDIDFTTYPDITVVCGRLETDAQDKNAIVNPVLLVEVLSDSTEAHDRGEKAAHDRKIASLKEYVIVSQREPRIEVFRRNEAGRWELYEAGRGESIELASVGCSVAVDDVYLDPLAGA